MLYDEDFVGDDFLVGARGAPAATPPGSLRPYNKWFYAVAEETKQECIEKAQSVAKLYRKKRFLSWLCYGWF